MQFQHFTATKTEVQEAIDRKGGIPELSELGLANAVYYRSLGEFTGQARFKGLAPRPGVLDALELAKFYAGEIQLNSEELQCVFAVQMPSGEVTVTVPRPVVLLATLPSQLQAIGEGTFKPVNCTLRTYRNAKFSEKVFQNFLAKGENLVVGNRQPKVFKPAEVQAHFEKTGQMPEGTDLLLEITWS